MSVVGEQDDWLKPTKLPDVPKLMPTTYDLEQRMERLEEKVDELRELIEKMHADIVAAVDHPGG